jgi:hypothetical protein
MRTKCHDNSTKNSQNDDTVPWQQQPFCSSSSLYRWMTMIIDIRYIIVLYCIVWFDQKKWFICLLQQQMTSGRMPCMMLTTDNLMNAGNCCLKCFMICLSMVPCTHLYWLWMQEVLNALCIAVHQETDGWYVFLNFCNVPFCLQWIDLTHTMLLYFLIHFQFLKGMIWLRTLALLIFASYWLSVYAKRIRDGGAAFWYALLILIWSQGHKTAVKDQTC